MINIEKEDNGKKGRFVLYDNEQYAAEMTFTWVGDKLFIIDHTGVEEEFGGKGYGRKLFLETVKFAREAEVKVLPLCPFVKAEFDKHSEYSDLLHQK